MLRRYDAVWLLSECSWRWRLRASDNLGLENGRKLAFLELLSQLKTNSDLSLPDAGGAGYGQFGTRPLGEGGGAGYPPHPLARSQELRSV